MKIKKLAESTKRIKFINLNGSRYARNLTESFVETRLKYTR